MEYLAISNSMCGKAVYHISNDIEKENIMRKYGCCGYKIFDDDQLGKALSWANVDKVSDVPDDCKAICVINESKKQHPFLLSIDKLIEKGYTHAKVVLNNGNSFVFLIRDFYLMANLKYVTVSYDVKFDKNKNPISVDSTYHGLRCCDGCFPEGRYEGDRFFSRLEENFRNQLPKGVDYKKCLKLLLQRQSGQERTQYDFGFFRVYKTKIEVMDNFTIFDTVMPKGISYHEINGAFSPSNCCHDYVLNMDCVSSVEPFKFDHTIDNPTWIEVIDEIEANGRVSELDHWQP